MKNEKKKSLKKLSLAKETLRNLTPAELARVAGGARPDPSIDDSDRNGEHPTCEGNGHHIVVGNY